MWILERGGILVGLGYTSVLLLVASVNGHGFMFHTTIITYPTSSTIYTY
jgi:hypothetical protein